MKTPILIALLTCACEPSVHLGAGYGSSVHAAFDRQAVRPPGQAASGPAPALDSQEATALWNAYLHSLTPKSRDATFPGGAVLLGLPAPDGLIAPAPAPAGP